MDSSSPTGPALVPIVLFSNLTKSKWTLEKALVRRTGVLGAVLFLIYSSLSLSSSAFGQTAQPITINFDSLASGAVVTNQYSQVKFSATGFGAGSGGAFGSDLRTQNNSGLGSSPSNGIRSWYNQYYPSYPCSANSEVFLDFPVPVKNFSFLMLNMYANYLGSPYNTYAPYTSGLIDVYVNGSFYGTFNIDIPGQYRNPSTPFPINFLSGIQNITGIRIRSVSGSGGPLNAAPSPGCGSILYDDFTFTPDLAVGITNPRVSGSLNGTTQKALVGADIVLNANVIPSTRTGGAYSWTFTGPYVVSGGAMNSSSVTIRSTDVGTITATANYTLNGVPATGSVNIAAELPTLTSFTAQVSTDRISRNQHCSGAPLDAAQYSLGCWHPGGPDEGIVFTANAGIQSTPYLSNPAQSGIKIKQFVSQFRKRVNDIGNGNFECLTVRPTQNDVDGGWQLDGVEAMTHFIHPPPTFGQSNTLSYSAFDAPSDSLEYTSYPIFSMHDVLFVDDRFQAFVFYYVGDPLEPIFQRPLRLTSQNTYNFSYIGWKWNGQAILEYNTSNNLKYRLQFTNTPSLAVSGTNTLPTLHGNVTQTQYGQCVGDPAPSTNKIDGARCFVTQQYWDFKNAAPDPAGLDNWTADIAQCAFDRNCIAVQRNHVVYSFFVSGVLTDPGIANPPGSPGYNPAVYNPAFIRLCYEILLRRQPDELGYNNWLNELNADNNYFHIIAAFIQSPEYRTLRTFHSCS
jgi:hypothetical protein